MYKAARFDYFRHAPSEANTSFISTPHRTSLLLSFARLFWICEILIAQNKSVQLRQFHYVCPLLCRCWYTYYHWALTRTSTNIVHSFEKRCFFSKYLWHKLKFVPYATIVCVSRRHRRGASVVSISCCSFFLIVKRTQKLVFSFFSFSL